MPLLLSLLCLLRLVAASAAFQTIAIDDTYGDEATGALPVYSPPTKWSQGQRCALDDDECLVNPDPSMVLNGSWHDSVGSTADAPPRTIDLVFEGNSISVYCIVSEVDRAEIAVSNMTFALDGQEVGKFFRDVSGQMNAAGDYEIHYNFQVYNGSVPEGNHTLRINSVGYSRMLFDYALYTTASDLLNTTVSPSLPSPTASGQAPGDASRGTYPRIGVIAGTVAAGTVALLAIGIVLFVYMRRRRRLARRHEADHSNNTSKPKRRLQGQGRRDATNYASSVASLPYEGSIASGHPYTYSPHSGCDANTAGFSRGPSPSDSAVPLLELSPSDADPFARGQQPRIVLDGTETRLEGPDNSMARLARKQIAEREAELSRRVREVETALATRRSTDRPSDDVESSSTSLMPGPGLSQAGPSPIPVTTGTLLFAQGPSETVLRNQLNELRAEMERMKIMQQQMKLELRDAIEPPPGYQVT